MLTSGELEKHETVIRKALVDTGSTDAWNSLNRLMEEADETRNLEHMLVELIGVVEDHCRYMDIIELPAEIEAWWAPRREAARRRKEIATLQDKLAYLEAKDAQES